METEGYIGIHAMGTLACLVRLDFGSKPGMLRTVTWPLVILVKAGPRQSPASRRRALELPVSGLHSLSVPSLPVRWHGPSSLYLYKVLLMNTNLPTGCVVVLLQTESILNDRFQQHRIGRITVLLAAT